MDAPPRRTQTGGSVVRRQRPQNGAPRRVRSRESTAHPTPRCGGRCNGSDRTSGRDQARLGGGSAGGAAMPAALSEATGPSRATSGNRSERLSSTKISDGTAASQLSDWPWQPSARQATMTFAVSTLGCNLSCDEQQVCPVVDDLQQAAFEWQQLGVVALVSKDVTTFTDFCESGRPPASSPASVAASSAKSGGFTPLFSAQASRSASVWQQQFRQQCSAESQPQPHDSHGYRSPVFAGPLVTGSGTPAATTT